MPVTFRAIRRANGTGTGRIPHHFGCRNRAGCRSECGWNLRGAVFSNMRLSDCRPAVQTGRVARTRARRKPAGEFFSNQHGGILPRELPACGLDVLPAKAELHQSQRLPCISTLLQAHRQSPLFAINPILSRLAANIFPAALLEVAQLLLGQEDQV
jgi:hypothetical protein